MQAADSWGLGQYSWEASRCACPDLMLFLWHLLLAALMVGHSPGQTSDLTRCSCLCVCPFARRWREILSVQGGWGQPRAWGAVAGRERGNAQPLSALERGSLCRLLPGRNCPSHGVFTALPGCVCTAKAPLGSGWPMGCFCSLKPLLLGTRRASRKGWMSA